MLREDLSRVSTDVQICRLEQESASTLTAMIPPHTFLPVGIDEKRGRDVHRRLETVKTKRPIRQMVKTPFALDKEDVRWDFSTPCR